MDLSKSNCVITCYFFLFSFLVVNSSDPHFANTNCSDSRSFTSDSIYKSNLDSLLTNFSTAADPFYASRFQTDTSGQGSDIVYGMFLCEGQVSIDNCRECIKVAARVVVDTCTIQKSAITWYENCMLRYSDTNFTGVMETVPSYVRTRLKDIADPNLRSKPFTLIYKLIGTVQESEDLYAYAKKDERNYWIVQCTRDINASVCGTCLNTLIKEGEEKSRGKIGWHLANV
ncbi:Cysteine-rich repeat secretory protein 38 [Cardamine amara subsp. amara]|uniref:Cysteine-rich repeat secretory protein 38 n=1 Tax=Cardamine amara subsp. amara TaxID=228776 RepID=A0ABD1C9J8_CARAN